MIACFDVGYHEPTATAACVLFENWRDAQSAEDLTVTIQSVEPYVPGQFYLRELPCILQVLQQCQSQPDILVVDGYCWLDDHGRKGLGCHLYDAMGSQRPVIGVAKTTFVQSNCCVEVFRGTSQRPLMVTAVGMEVDDAALHIQNMHGENRIPTMLKLVDQLSRVE